MKILLDANILIQDFSLKGAHLVNLCESVSLVDGTVYVPEVAVLEAVNKFGEELESARDTIEKGIRTLNRISPFPPYPNPVNEKKIEKLTTDYDRYLRERLMTLKIEILPIPEIPHATIIVRDLARKKPFKTNGAGYRDMLIWENVRLCCDMSAESELPDVVFISQNSKDFCNPDDCLHDDFIEDLKQSGIAPDRIRMARSVEIVVKDYISPRQANLTAIKDKLNQDNKYNKINVRSVVEDALDDFLRLRTFTPEESPFGPKYIFPRVCSMLPPSFKVLNVRKMSINRSVIDLYVWTECRFGMSMLLSDYKDLASWDRPNLEIGLEYDNKHVVVTRNCDVSFDMTLIVDENFDRVISHDISICRPTPF